MTTTTQTARDPRPHGAATTPAAPATDLAATTEDATVTVLPTTGPTDPGDPKAQARAALKSRHSQGLSKLLTERDDLRGVHALADFVHDSVRWTA